MEFDRVRIRKALTELANKATEGAVSSEDFKEICQAMNVVKMYYDLDLGDGRYINPVTNELIVATKTEDGKIILYDEHESSDLVLEYTYYYGDLEYVHAYIEFSVGIKKEDLDLPLYKFMADQMFIIVSRQNLRTMLDFAEMYDDQTCIPNSFYLKKMYRETVAHIAPQNFVVLFINLQNFKYINKTGGVGLGDKAMIKYAHTVLTFVDSDEGVCRLGGDNYVMFVKKENLSKVLSKLDCVCISNISDEYDKSFAVSAWIGISPDDDADVTIDMRIEHASVACAMGKTQLRKKVVIYTKELAAAFGRSKEITAMFRPAVANHEFRPFFQPKVNMLTGKIIGLEALCRWIHDDKFIYPDQFIPILDRQGLIHELDMTILHETCLAIKKWEKMGVKPPVVSVNLSRKNLFVPDIENKILSIIKNDGVSTDNIEIEITETAKEDEFDRLIDFLAILKSSGLKISIDDFGTGYSSLSLIHNINADIVKIDKSFVGAVTNDSKAQLLIETIINIAKRLDMDIIAEGIETADEGKALINMGCVNAQGYYYSRPVDFDTATKLIKDDSFKPIG